MRRRVEVPGSQDHQRRRSHGKERSEASWNSQRTHSRGRLSGAQPSAPFTKGDIGIAKKNQGLRGATDSESTQEPTLKAGSWDALPFTNDNASTTVSSQRWEFLGGRLRGWRFRSLALFGEGR